MKTPNDVAVVGMSCIFPGAKDLATFWDNIVNKKSGIQIAPEERVSALFFDPNAQTIDRHAVNKGGFVDEFLEFNPVEFGMVPNAVQGIEVEHLVALKLAKVALEDAGVFEKKFSLENAGIIIGKSSFSSKQTLKLHQIVEGAESIASLLRTLCPQLNESDIIRVKQAYQSRVGNFNSQNIMGVVPNLTAALVANRFNLGGPAYTLDAACASSLLGIENGIRELQSERCNLVLVGGIHLLQCPAMFSFFQTLGTLSKQQEIRPFDQQADGLLTGEGCGFVVLKRLAEAIADGDRIYSVIKGAGVSSDGNHASVLSPSSVGQIKAIDRAWAMTGYTDRLLGYIETHGTGTVLGDQTELHTLMSAFPHAQGSPKAGLGAVKAQIGHTMAAAGMAGFIKTAMALHKGIIPPTINCSQPLAAMADSHFQPIQEPLEWSQTGLPMRAGVNAFGFGGTNAHIVLEHYENDVSTTKDEYEDDDQVVLLARDSREELISALSGKESTIGTGCFRIALFNPTEKRRELAVRIVQKGVNWKGRQDVWFTASPLLNNPESKLAFLFPGMDVPALNALSESNINALADFLQVSPSKYFYKGVADTPGRQLENFQLLTDAALKKSGITPDGIAGHSLGEWTAGRSIAVLSPELIHKIAKHLLNENHVPIRASFLSVGCSLEDLRGYLKDEQGIFVSNDNCNYQVVVSAIPEQALRFQEKLTAAGVISYILPFETSYHTPFAEIYVQGVRDALADMSEIALPAIPIWSCISATQYEASIAAIHCAMIDFITHPVRFREMIENMYADGFRIFVQIGDGALTGFVSNILDGKPHTIIASGSTKRPVLAQLQRVVAALFVEGKTADLSLLKLNKGGKSALQKEKGLSVKLDLDYSPINFQHIIAPDIIQKVASTNSVNTTLDTKQAVINAFERNLLQMEQTQTAFLSLFSSRSKSLVPSSGSVSTTSVRSNIKKEIEFSLAAFPYLIDHCPFRKRSITHNFDNEQQAIVPFTLFIDLVSEFFLARFPALPLMRITDVKVHQFLWLEDDKRLELRGEWQSETCIRFVIDGVFEANVHTEGNTLSFAAPVVIQAPELQPPVLAAEIYSQGYMFHGPLYQGIKQIVRFTAKSLETRLKGISIKGALLDNMGQTLGLLNHFLGASLRSFPVAVEQIDFYQSPIDQSGNFDCRAYVTAEDNDFYYSTIELTRDGLPWCKFSLWKTKKSDLDNTGWQLLSRIEGRHLSTPIGEGLFVLPHNRYKQANSWFIMAEIYLSVDENKNYQTLPIAQQREYLLGRITAKDALRDLLLTQHSRVTHPALFSFDDNFCLTATADAVEAESIQVSIASEKSCTVAFACKGSAKKIHVSLISAIDKNVIASDDVKLIPASTDVDEWAARIVTVREVYKKIKGEPLVSDNKILPLSGSGFDFLVNKTAIRTVKHQRYIIGWEI